MERLKLSSATEVTGVAMNFINDFSIHGEKRLPRRRQSKDEGAVTQQLTRIQWEGGKGSKTDQRIFGKYKLRDWRSPLRPYLWSPVVPAKVPRPQLGYPGVHTGSLNCLLSWFLIDCLY